MQEQGWCALTMTYTTQFMLSHFQVECNIVGAFNYSVSWWGGAGISWCDLQAGPGQATAATDVIMILGSSKVAGGVHP